MTVNFLIFCLALTVSAAIMATDLYLPSLPAMVIDFSTDESAVQKTISFSFLGVCLSSLVSGSLADRFTKARVFQGAMVLFVITGVLSPLCASIEMLWGVRFLQGLAVGALPVIIMAIVSDLYAGIKLTKIMTMLGVVITVSLAFSPVLGGWIGEVWGWKGCFWITSAVVFVLTALLWRAFPQHTESVFPLSLKLIKGQIVNLMSHQIFKLMCICHGLVFASALMFRSTLSHYFADILNIGPLEFGTFLSGATFANAVTGLSMGPLLNRFHPARLMEVGMGIFALSCGVLIFVCFCIPQNLASIFFVMVLNNVGVALCFSTTLSLSLIHLNSSKGFASSALISFRSFLAGLAIYGGGALYNQNLWSLALPFIVLTALFIGVYMKGRFLMKTDNM